VDGSEPLTEADRQIADLTTDKTTILVVNKTDLPRAGGSFDVLPEAMRVEISALTGEGLEELEGAIMEVVFSGKVLASDEPLVSSPRHKNILKRALDHVANAQGAHAEGMPADFVAIDLTSAVNALGEITGEMITEDLLETIFSEFCVGK